MVVDNVFSNGGSSFLGRGAWAIPRVEILAKEILVVGVVPHVLSIGRRRRLRISLVHLGREGVLDDLLIQHVDELQRRHR